MNLTRPIVFMDTEATGADAQRDRVVEIALIKRMPDNSTKELIYRVNPGMRIPTEVVAIHGIRNEDVANAPTFKQIAAPLLDFMEGCDLGGFGITRFDIPILMEEFKRSGHSWTIDGRAILDGLTIFHQREPRNLSAAYKFYCDKVLEGAHGARADAVASMEVLFAQVQRYEDLPKHADGLHAYCNKQDARFVDSTRKLIWRDGEAAFNFGKYKGETLKKMANEQSDYLQWIVSDGKFPQEVVDICWKALNGEFPKNANGNGKNGNGNGDGV